MAIYKSNKIKIDDLRLIHYNMLVKQLNNNKLVISYKNQIINLLKSIIKYSYKYYNTNTKLLAYIEVLKRDDSKITIDFYTIDEKTLTTKIKGENWNISTPKTKNSLKITTFDRKNHQRFNLFKRKCYTIF